LWVSSNKQNAYKERRSMKERTVLKIHINRQLPNDWGYFSVTVEEGIYEDDRRVPLVYTFICKNLEEAKALRNEILSRYPDAIEEIRQEVKGDL